MRNGDVRRTILGAIATTVAPLLCLLILAGCATSSSVTAKPSETATVTAPTGTAQEQALSRLAQSVAGPMTVRVSLKTDTAASMLKVTATLTGDIARTSDEIAASQERVKVVIFVLEHALWTDGSAASVQTVNVNVLGPLLDDYFDRTTDWYGGAQVSAKTDAGLTWNTLTADAAWNAYDFVWLRPYYSPFQQWGAPNPTQP